MEEPKTPPWAKRIEEKLNKLIEKKEEAPEKCYHHAKYGAEAKRKCDPPCQFSLMIGQQQTVKKPASLSPVVSSILSYMKQPYKLLSPIRDLPMPMPMPTIVPVGQPKQRKVEEDVKRLN